MEASTCFITYALFCIVGDHTQGMLYNRGSKQCLNTRSMKLETCIGGAEAKSRGHWLYFSPNDELILADADTCECFEWGSVSALCRGRILSARRVLCIIRGHNVSLECLCTTPKVSKRPPGNRRIWRCTPVTESEGTRSGCTVRTYRWSTAPAGGASLRRAQVSTVFSKLFRRNAK